MEINTRPIRVERDIRREDLLAPAHEGLVLLLAACLACGLMISILYVVLPVMFVSFVVGFDLGSWLTALVGASSIAIAAFLVIWEIRFRRDLANDL
jgi:hypothetical protein